MEKIRVGIIGCGAIFPMHSVSITQCQDAELVAVCDVIEERAQKKANQLGCAYYTDYKEMVEKERLDSVHVCLPHYLHAPVSIWCMEKGLHVLTEKPMATNDEDAVAMMETAKRCGVKLACIFQNRFNHGNRLLKEALDSGRLGRIYGAKCSVTWHRDKAYYENGEWRSSLEEGGGGVIINQAIHTIDAMRYLMNSDAVRVDATVTRRGGLDIEVEDTAEGVIEFENGVLANFHAINYYSTDSTISVEFDCEKGVATLLGDTATIKLNDGTVLVSHDDEEVVDYGKVKSYWGICHKKQIADYYHHIKTGEPMYITLESAYETQKVVFAIYESGREHKPVYLK
ncbi:MAG: Gfo/Idh/MocA family oxidoreductase [Clostridia bacterium]|nr:Gfo/Idh/MocA family oxidoreductase [Clostridia bacterium]